MALNEALENFAFYMKQQAPDTGCVAIKLLGNIERSFVQIVCLHISSYNIIYLIIIGIA